MTATSAWCTARRWRSPATRRRQPTCCRTFSCACTALRGRIDLDRPLEPWLYRMTANLSYTWVKRHTRWTKSLEDIAEWLMGGWKNPPLQQVELNDTWTQIQGALADLPISQRVVVVLYYLNDLSLQEIAETLEIPVGTVKSRLHYGRQALKENLGLLAEEGKPEMRYEFT